MVSWEIRGRPTKFVAHETPDARLSGEPKLWLVCLLPLLAVGLLPFLLAFVDLRVWDGDNGAEHVVHPLEGRVSCCDSRKVQSFWDH
jgi:hypothetical protein